jgi:hypothetical protein
LLNRSQSRFCGGDGRCVTQGGDSEKSSNGSHGEIITVLMVQQKKKKEVAWQAKAATPTDSLL